MITAYLEVTSMPYEICALDAQGRSMGSYFRTSTEHVLFGVRGHLLTRVRNIGTHFTAPKTFHSEKPDCFYELVERASYPPYVDVFARKKRPGWAAWGNAIHAAA